MNIINKKKGKNKKLYTIYDLKKFNKKEKL